MERLTLSPPRLPAPGLDISRAAAARLPLGPQLKAARARIRFALRPQTSPMRLFAASRTIFVRVPKNASSSLAAFLYPDTPTDWLPHYAADFYRSVFPAEFGRYLVFAPLRHPIERLASAFSYYRSTSTVPEERRLMDEELPFLKTFADLLAWLDDQERPEQTRLMTWHHFRPQRDFICDRIGQVIVDLLFPVEDMTEGLTLLASHTGRDGSIPRLNRSPSQGQALKVSRRVMSLYSDDLDLWARVRERGVLLPTSKARRLGLVEGQNRG